MLQPLLSLYNLLDASREKFAGRQLEPVAFVDIYRSQPLEPELYEYFPLPALFVDYTMQGQGYNAPRLVTMTLHIVTDAMPDTSSISAQRMDGVKRFLYNMTIQELLENARLGNTGRLRFITEALIDAPVVNYHVQTYEFEAYLKDIVGENPEQIVGEFERLRIFGSLTNRPL
jgi:hypothetical protein